MKNENLACRVSRVHILGRTPQVERGSSIAFELEGKVCAPLHGLHGNVAKIISSGTQEDYRYIALGEPRSTSSLSPWRFSSKRLDPESGLIYFGRRYYMPSHGHWLTPDPLGLDAGPNLYAFVSNCPLTHVDLYGLMGFYGLGLREEFKEFNSKIGVRFASANRQDYKQIGIGALHGVGDFAMGAFTAASYAGYGLSLPFQSIGWLSGSGSLSQSWSSFRSSNEAFFHKGSSLMHRILPGDTSSDFYRGARWGSEISLEVATAITGIGALRRGISLATRSIGMHGEIVKMPKETTELAKLNSLLRWPSPAEGRTKINGIKFTTHALERMAPRGLIQSGTNIISRGVPTSVVENAIKFGAKTIGNTSQEIVHIFENVRVVTNLDSTKVITVITTGK